MRVTIPQRQAALGLYHGEGNGGLELHWDFPVRKGRKPQHEPALSSSQPHWQGHWWPGPPDSGHHARSRGTGITDVRTGKRDGYAVHSTSSLTHLERNPLPSCPDPGLVTFPDSCPSVHPSFFRPSPHSLIHPSAHPSAHLPICPSCPGTLGQAPATELKQERSGVHPSSTERSPPPPGLLGVSVINRTPGGEDRNAY